MSESIIRILNQSGWNYKLSYEGVSILAPTKQDATNFAQSYGYALSQTAAKIQGKVQIGWKRCKHPIEFYGWMASQQPLRGSAAAHGGNPQDRPGLPSTPALTAERLLPFRGAVFSSQLDLPVTLLRRMVAAAENDRPVSIIRQDNHKQIIINEPMSDMLQTPPEIATQRVITQFWLREDLAELERRLRHSSRFTWTYSGGLNEQTWAILTTQFEIFEAEGIWYRQGTCLATHQIVPIPGGACAPA